MARKPPSRPDTHQAQPPGSAQTAKSERQQIIDAFMGQFQGGTAPGSRRTGGERSEVLAGPIPGGDHGSAPTKPGWKASLYRSGGVEGKHQGEYT